MKKIVLKAFLAVTILAELNCAPGPKTSSSNSSPNQLQNIILIVADDLGRNDIAPYSEQFIETPRLSQMAAQGILMNNAYAAAPLCSPTRASIISGNNPARINLTEHLHGHSPPKPTERLATPRIATGLAGELVTIPEALKSAGYKSGHFGKWHLGTGESSPAAQGFDVVYGGGAEGLPKTFFYPFFNGKPYPDLLADTKQGDYLDDALTSRALQFIGESKAQRFFVELNFYAPHVPIEGKPELVKKYADKRSRSGYNGLPENEYAAMVENIDYNVGRVLDYLRQQGLDKNTLVIFTSDNGGLDVEEVPAFAKHTPPTTNAPHRGGKGHITEGGIREPWIIWAPAMVTKGKTSEAIVTTDDIFNTCMAVAGVKNTSPDGQSLYPLLAGKTLPDKPYFLHFPHYSPQHGLPGAVVRMGRYKLIEWYETGTLELYDLQNDEGEQNDLSQSHREKTIELKQMLDAWRASIGAKMAEPNPGFKG